jgi:hypothetical protein
MDASETSLDVADQINVHQRLEGQDLQQLAKGTSSAKKTVCSFWVRSSVASTYTLELQDSDNNRSISKTYTINAADTWEKKEVVFDGDTTGALNNDNGRSMDVRWWIDAGSNYTSGTLATSWATVTTANRVSATTGWLESTSPEFYITGVQWELGETATPFEHRSYADELRRCQRYYQKLYSDAAYGYPSLFISIGTAATQSYGVTQFITPMRAAPTFSTTGNFRLTDQNTAVAITSFTLDSDRSGVLSGEFNIQTASGLTAQQTYFVHNNNDTSAALLFSAEL